MSEYGALSQAQWPPAPGPPPAAGPPPVAGWPPAPGPPHVAGPPPAPGPPTAVGPPRGPGVTPPFGAPPTDRDARTVWIRVGVSALLVLLCCLGGGAGIGVVVAAAPKQVAAQARAVVEEYLGALRSEDYRHAYDLLCQAATSATSLDTFTERQEQRPVTGYVVDGVRTDSDLVVSASVTYRDEAAVPREYIVTIEGQLRICGER